MDQWAEQAAEYALGTLSTADRADFEGHLLGCPDCAAEVDEFMQVANDLACATTPRSPDPTLRGRVVEAARRATGGRSFPVRVPASLHVGRRPWLVAAASIILSIGLATYAVGLRRAASEAKTVVVVLAASDLVRVDLTGQAVAPQASARAFWSRSRGLVFTGANLPALAKGRTYQLWIVAGDTPVGAGLLKPGADGRAHAVFTPPSGVLKAAAIAVTDEPDGGVPAPTGDKYLIGLVSAPAS